jgi:hypothetical protein
MVERSSTRRRVGASLGTGFSIAVDDVLSATHQCATMTSTAGTDVVCTADDASLCER